MHGWLNGVRRRRVLRDKLAGAALFGLWTLAFGLGTLSATNAPNCTLAWDLSPGPAIAGYNLYTGPRTRQYTTNYPAGLATTITVPVLPWQRTYLAVTAVDISGLESDYSNEVIWTNRLPAKTNLQLTVNFPGPQILVAQDLAGPWTDLKTLDFGLWTLDSGLRWVMTNPPAPLYFRGQGATDEITIEGIPFWTSPINDVPR
jgi:hypothetical protein